MNFSEWRKLQRDREMFQFTEAYVAEGLSQKQFQDIIHSFIPFVKKELGIKDLPSIHFVTNSKFAKKISAFGEIKNNRIVIDIQNRQIMDVLRTLSHELIHYRQHTRNIHGSGKAGSPTENEANRIAGVILRKYGEKHSDLFALPAIAEAKKQIQKRKLRRELEDIDYDHYPAELS